jgi:hypothetical protein
MEGQKQTKIVFLAKRQVWSLKKAAPWGSFISTARHSMHWGIVSSEFPV